METHSGLKRFLYKFVLLFDLGIQMEIMAKRDILLYECMLHI